MILGHLFGLFFPISELRRFDKNEVFSLFVPPRRGGEETVRVFEVFQFLSVAQVEGPGEQNHNFFQVFLFLFFILIY